MQPSCLLYCLPSSLLPPLTFTLLPSLSPPNPLAPSTSPPQQTTLPLPLPLHTYTSLIPTTSNETLHQNLLSLLRHRKTQEVWLAYSTSPSILSRLVSHLSFQNTPSSLRHERQLHRLDANCLGLLTVAATKVSFTLYVASIVKSMLRSGYLPHVKAWSAVASGLSSSGDDGPVEALRLFKAVTRRVKKFSDIRLVSNSRSDTGAFNAALNACANLGDSEKFLQVFDELPIFGVQPDALTYNVLLKLCCRTDRRDLLVFVLERILEVGIPLRMTTLHSLVSAYVGFVDMKTAEKLVQAMREQRTDLCKILRESSSEILVEVKTQFSRSCFQIDKPE